MKNKLFKKNIAVLVGTFCMAFLAGCSNEAPANATKAGQTKSEQTQSEGKKEVGEESKTEEKTGIDLSDASLLTEGRLTVGMVIDYPPFEYYPSNGDIPIGIDVDIINAVAKKLGLETDIKNVPWDDDLFTNMGSKYDVVCSAVTITEERLENMIFSDSYIDNYQSVVVCKESAVKINGFSDLEGLKVAVQKDTVSDELMHSYFEEQEMEIFLTENEVATDCFEQLKEGKVDAVVCDSTVAEGQVSRNAQVLVEAYRDESKVEKFAIAIEKTNKGLQKAINEALEEIRAEGAEKTIIDNWFK